MSLRNVSRKRGKVVRSSNNYKRYRNFQKLFNITAVIFLFDVPQHTSTII